MPDAWPASMSRGAALARLRRTLAAAGLETPALDARLLLLHGLGLDAARLARDPEAPLGEAGARRLAEAANRRLAHEPVARILGEQEFWGLRLRLSPATLVPRPETETVVEAALAAKPDRLAALRILDLGTGSGAILLALLYERPRSRGFGLDRSPEAAATARSNAAALGLGRRAAFAVGHWADAIGASFDLVVSNPPYIESAMIDALQPEVALHDPHAALDGGPDGLAAYRAIAAALPRLLASGGLAVLEVGAGQAAAVSEIFSAAGLAAAPPRPDLSGIARAITLFCP